MKTIAYLLTALVLLTSCGRFGNKDIKQENETRIVSVSKQYTEIIYALGAEKDLIAVDVSSVYPPEVKELPTVGYHRALSLEAMLAVKPTIILHSDPKTIGPDHVVSQLESLNIPIKQFDADGEDIESTKALIKEMGVYFQKEKTADSLCDALNTDMNLALNSKNTDMDTPSAIVIHYGRASNVYLVMTSKSHAAQMVEWAGGKMALSGEKGMVRLVSPEIIAEANPDIILLTDFGYDRLNGSKEQILELPGVASTKAAETGRIYRVEENDMVYFGPRTGKNILKLRDLLHSQNAE